MANYLIRHHVEVVDVNGDTASTSYPTRTSDATTVAILATANAAFGAAVSAATNGKVIKRDITIQLDEAQFLVGVTPPTNAEYSSVTDGARLQFTNADGARTSLTIPAPLETNFGASSNVVNSLDANMAALITLITGNASDFGGNLYNLYKGGVKVGRGTRKRRSSLIP